MDANAQFCTKCGKSVTTAATSSSTATGAARAPIYPPSAVPPSSSGGSNALKIVLVIVGVFVLIGILAASALMYTAHRLKQSFRASQDGRSSSVDFGGFKASTNKTDAQDLARKIGIDLYPGATQEGDSAEATFGNMTTATIKLTTSDSVSQVATFYKSRYPNAVVSTQGSDKFNLVGADNQGTLTITAQSEGRATKIVIAKVGGLKINVQPH
jgi:hypothetical protein